MKSFGQLKAIGGLIALMVIVCVLSSCASSGSSSTSSQSQSTEADSGQTVGSNAASANQIVRVKNGKTLVILPVTYKPGIHMNDVIRDQCMLPEKISGFVRDNALVQYENVVVDGSRAISGADVLDIQIIRLLAPKGGGWSGPKFVTVKGSLKHNGRVVGNFSGKRTSMGGAFGVFKGTCAILGRCTKALGQDIARWLQNPAKNSTLGQ